MSKLNTSPEQIPAGSHASSTNAVEAAPSSNHDTMRANNRATEEVSTEMHESSVVILERLARQVEYYFSTANLEKDTYVATLRSLNDGFVPLSIIANFGKVKTLVPYDAVNAVRRAAIDSSELLEVVHIHTQTGKRLDDETVATSPDVQTVEAVGPKTGQPIPMNSINQIPVSPAVIKPANTATVQNTLIIREVPEGIVESQIRDLFAFEKCPPIHGLHLDVANCWFVTLDTNSKDDMINVMFELRSKKFPSGESVKARLKTALAMNADVSPVNFRFAQPDTPMLYAPQLQGNLAQHGNRRGNSRKKKNANNASSKAKTDGVNKNGKLAQSNYTNLRHRNNNFSDGTKQSNKKNRAKRQDGQGSGKILPRAPPSWGEGEFPSLSSDDMNSNKKIEVEVPEHRPDDDDIEKPSSGSDSASTATTTSSSSSSKNAPASSQPVGGYAAALLKTAPPTKAKPEEEEKTDLLSRDMKETTEGSESAERKDQNDVEENVSQNDGEATATSDSTAASVGPPSWGGGRSFADVLRKQEAAAAVAAAPEQSA